VGHQRPNDARAFIHKTILGIGSSIIGTVTNLPGVSLLPGSGILRGAGELAGRLSRTGGGTTLPIIPPSLSGARGGGGLPRLPESDPMGKNRQVGITPQDTFRSALQTNGACAPATGIGNRRVNAAGQCAPPGWHWNVSGYHRKGGPCSKFAPGFVDSGTVLVRNRSMSKNNGKAEDRAIKRLDGSVDHAKKILRATGYRTVSKQSSRELRRPRRGHR